VLQESVTVSDMISRLMECLALPENVIRGLDQDGAMDTRSRLYQDMYILERKRSKVLRKLALLRSVGGLEGFGYGWESVESSYVSGLSTRGTWI
jgi:hypothetical protein